MKMCKCFELVVFNFSVHVLFMNHSVTPTHVIVDFLASEFEDDGDSSSDQEDEQQNPP